LSRIRIDPFLEFEEDGNALLRGQAEVFFHVRRVGFLETREGANGLLHQMYFTAGSILLV
jgi:hypothetical protein